ncbi:NADP-dependent oxidoreductase domain-containing protein [Mycena maculata]|uniref:NADP-dependent oxidoreductase domain-containing protein n=1 Tax=Mycena maculata TaxID=230809 RepID=A0AAD7MUZ6_9AGAR|nr:NADP-dependent oxidoreductase domain-containing protein [Mycena maculata]
MHAEPLKGITRLWCGLWRLSSKARGSAPMPKIWLLPTANSRAQLNVFTLADHYGSTEMIHGQCRKTLPSSANVVGATKWCVLKPSRAVMESPVRERLARMQTDRVDPYKISTQLGPGVIVSNQVQFSLIDTRTLHGMTDVGHRHNVKLLTYGTLCGGFLPDRWLDQPEPDLYSGDFTPSQRKYLDMIVKAWGTLTLFQVLLGRLRTIAGRHEGINIASITTRWVLDKPCVGAVLIGARLGLSDHLDDKMEVFQPTCCLTDEDNRAIEDILQYSNGRKIITTIGDSGAEPGRSIGSRLGNG